MPTLLLNCIVILNNPCSVMIMVLALIEKIKVGYTNAGKSTLLNQLTGANVLAEDRLFATLDPTTRRVQVGLIGLGKFSFQFIKIVS